MSDAEEPQPAASGKKSRLMLILVIVLVLGLGTGAFFYFQGSLFGAKAKGKKAQAAADETASGDETDSASDEASDESTDTKDAKTKAQDDSRVKQVIELQPFIVNLSDKEEARYLRITISLGVAGEGKAEEKPDSLFTTRVRNALLSVMTSKTSAEVLSVEGKDSLRRELLKAAKAVSKEPKVYAIYITDFIVQL